MGGLFTNGKSIFVTIFALWKICSSQQEELTPAIFVFGDSLLDVGNNNYISTTTKANVPPNGIDFGYPSGRFTNDRTVMDIIGQNLGFSDFTPPYLAPTTTGEAILKGVNYASGGGGILNETGEMFIGAINMDEQIDNFANTRQDIVYQIGMPATLELLRSALFVAEMGSSDFISCYSVAPTKPTSPEAFVGTLIAKYRLQLTRLYNLGARKMGVVNVGPKGCLPYERDVNFILDPNHCAEFVNQLVTLFNTNLNSLVNELNSNLPGAKFLYVDVYSVMEEIIENYTSYGFENQNSACCRVDGDGGGRYGGLRPCGVQPYKVCEDRSKYAFWDAYHPSDAANIILARAVLYGNSSVISPMNFVQLLQSSSFMCTMDVVTI